MIEADRAGMSVSLAQAGKLGDKFGTAPVCVGPWTFVEPVPQDRIVLEKSAHYFDRGQARFALAGDGLRDCSTLAISGRGPRGPPPSRIRRRRERAPGA